MTVKRNAADLCIVMGAALLIFGAMAYHRARSVGPAYEYQTQMVVGAALIVGITLWRPDE
jgi:hypothetical protein